MSLKIWLPLNGTLENKGCGDLTKTSTAEGSYYTNGKIGSAYNLNVRQNFTSNSLSGLTDFTIAFWGVSYPSETLTVNWSDAIGFTDVSTGGTSGQFRFETCYGSGYSSGDAFHWHDNGTNAIVNGSWSPSRERSIWHHYCVVVKGGEYIKSYFDGTLSKTITTNVNGGHLNGNFWIGETNAIEGAMNDVRIYDNCLSTEEVREISQALVVHYKLDNNGMGKENLYTGTLDFSGSWGNSSAWSTSVDKYHGFTVKYRNTIWGGLFQNVTCMKGDIFTISFYAKVDSGGNILSVHRSSLGNVTTGLTILNGNFSSSSNWVNSTEDGTEWKRYWGTIRIDSADITYLQWRIENSVSDKNLYVAGFKMERGSVATNWTPATSDALYSTLGMDQTIVDDSSGYGYYGTAIGDFSYSKDTARYHCSASFDGNDDCIVIPYNLACPDNIFTCNFWFKKEALGSKSYETLFGGPSGFEMDTRAGSTTTLSLYMASTRGGDVFSPFDLNKWYMVTMVRNGTNELYYINGELKKTINAKSMPVGTYYIGAWNSQTQQNYCGLISDFRIYATALSATDIMKLYNTGISIDNSKNIHAYSFEEDDTKNSPVIKNNGIFVAELLDENEKAAIYKNGLLEAITFIEK